MTTTLTPAAPTQYNNYVSMKMGQDPAAPSTPYVFATAASANDTAKLCAICFAEQQQKEKPLSHPLQIKFEAVDPLLAEAPVDRYKDESRYVCEWSEDKRQATVVRVERVRDGLLRNGYTITSLLATFTVDTVPRFISPLKVKQYFEKRQLAKASLIAAAEKKQAEDALAKMMVEAAKQAAAAAPPPPIVAAATGLPVVPATAPPAAPATATATAPIAIPAPPPLPPTPSFNDVFKEYTQ